MNIKRAIFSKFDPRIRFALKSLYDECRILRNHKRGVAAVRKLKPTGPLRVQFGCGRSVKQGWLNVDLWPGPWATPDLCLDVARPLPFASESVAEIYTEHMFEHLDYPAGARLFLTECHRVLERGGKLTIGVPDLDAILEHYQTVSKESLPPIATGPQFILGLPIEELNDAFHQSGEHKFLYDEIFLRALLTHFGFACVQRRAFDPDCDSESRRNGTLYLIAGKP